MLNTILILFTLLVIGFIGFMFMRRNKSVAVPTEDLRYEQDQIVLFVRKAFKDLINADPYAGAPSAEEFERRNNRRKSLRKALRGCMHGDASAKSYVKSYMIDLLSAAYGINETTINRVIDFDRPDRLSDQDVFEILLEYYKANFKKNAFTELMTRHGLDQLKTDPNGDRSYRVTSAEIRSVYMKENPKLSFEQKMQVVVQRIYQKYKGLGVIDELRDQDIDGVNGGTSGVPDSVVKSMEMEDDNYVGQIRQIARAYDAVWVFFKGKSVNLQFLSFGSEHELRRVCQNIYGFGSPGQLNEARGYIVNDMADGSRVVVLRPPFAESWAFFVRKHNAKLVELKDQVKGQNATLAIQLLTYLIKGKQNTLVTGQQGTGKTTLIKALVRYISAKNIRVQEMFAELWLRKLYPEKNVLSFQETPSISAQDGMDIQKKTDGAVNIVGEIASHAVASLAIQAGQVASEFTIASHHGVTFEKLVNAIRNSLIANGDFTDENAAEQQVVSWLNFNVHLGMTGSGHRYIERITECVPLASQDEYPAAEKHDEVFREYATRMTNPKNYHYHNVIIWNDEQGYIVNHAITPEKQLEMKRNMMDEDAQAFLQFVQEHWNTGSEVA